MENPEKHSSEQEFCCSTFFLLIVIQNNFWRTKPKCVLKFGSLFTNSKKKNLLCDVAWQEIIIISDTLNFSEEYTVGIDAF